MSETRQEGQNAYWKNVPGTENPYEAGTMEYIDWNHGWQDSWYDDGMISRPEDVVQDYQMEPPDEEEDGD